VQKKQKKQQVIIGVKGGVAHVRRSPKTVQVTIIDFDNRDEAGPEGCKVLIIEGIRLTIDAYGNDSVLEAHAVLKRLNQAIKNLDSCPHLDFETDGGLAFRARYEWAK